VEADAGSSSSSASGTTPAAEKHDRTKELEKRLDERQKEYEKKSRMGEGPPLLDREVNVSDVAESSPGSRRA